MRVSSTRQDESGLSIFIIVFLRDNFVKKKKEKEKEKKIDHEGNRTEFSRLQGWRVTHYTTEAVGMSTIDFVTYIE